MRPSSHRRMAPEPRKAPLSPGRWPLPPNRFAINNVPTGFYTSQGGLRAPLAVKAKSVHYLICTVQGDTSGMAKGRSRSSTSNAHGSSPSLTAPRLFGPILFTPSSYPDLTPIEDNRRWQAPLTSPKTLLGTPAQTQIKQPPKGRFKRPYGYVPTHVRFSAPESVVKCIRRKRRREVLFAKKRLNGNAKKSRNFWSKISCKR